MKVSIKRKAKSTWQANWVDTLRNAATWAGEYLNISKDFTLDLRLKHDYNVDYYGVQLSVDPLRRSVVILNSALLDMDESSVLEILFHELVHVAQEFHQGLVITECMTEAHFEGDVYEFTGEEHFFGTHGEHPWEIDAYKRQKELKRKYKKFLTMTP